MGTLGMGVGVMRGNGKFWDGSRNHEGKWGILGLGVGIMRENSLTGGKMGFLGLDFENHEGRCPGGGRENEIYGVGV